MFLKEVLSLACLAVGALSAPVDETDVSRDPAALTIVSHALNSVTVAWHYKLPEKPVFYEVSVDNKTVAEYKPGYGPLYVVGGLHECTAYTVQMTAHFKNGSISSVPKSCHTSCERPWPVSEFYTYSTNTSIEVSFERPKNVGGVDYYIVKLTPQLPDGTEGPTETLETPYTEYPTVTFDGLTQCSVYKIEVAGVRWKVIGEWVSKTALVDNPDRPDVSLSVTPLKVPGVNHTYFWFEFSSEHHRCATNFKIQGFGPDGRPEYTLNRPNTPDIKVHQWDSAGFAPCTLYSFTITPESKYKRWYSEDTNGKTFC